MRAFRFATFALLVAAPGLFAQSLDVVFFRDRTQDGRVVRVDANELKESVSSVEAIGGDKKRRALVSAADIIRIDYGNLPMLDRVAQQTAVRSEDTLKNPAQAATEYAALKKAGGANIPEKNRRYLEYREVMCLAAATGLKGGDEFKKEAKAAADKLIAFARANKKSWEVWPAYATAARLSAEIDDLKAAGNAAAELAGVADLSAELKAEARLIEADYRLRAGSYVDVRSALSDVEKAAKDLPAGYRDRLDIYTAALAALPPKEDSKDAGEPGMKKFLRPTDAVKKIEAVINRSKDPVARATGYGVLGELYLASKFPRDAMWAYLWVDTVYNTNPDQHVLAVHRLIDLFDAMGEKDGDKNRSDQFRERLLKIR